MNIYLLTRISEDAWTDYGSHQRMLVRAESEQEARAIAKEIASCDMHIFMADNDKQRIWTDQEMSSCDIVEPEGTKGIIISDYLRD